MSAKLTLLDLNEARYGQLLREQGSIPRALDTYGYRGPHHGRYVFLITDEHGLIVGGAECVPVLWHGRGVGESHLLVRDLVVLPRYRRRGLATTLLKNIMTTMQVDGVHLCSGRAPFLKMRAIITAGHGNAIRLFCQCGWEPVEGTHELYEYELV